MSGVMLSSWDVGTFAGDRRLAAERYSGTGRGMLTERSNV